MDRARTYDDASWHLRGTVPAGTTERQAFTHIGVYIAWLISRDLQNASFFAHIEEGASYIKAMVQTGRTPSKFRRMIAATLPSEVMNPVGRAFTDWYYGGPRSRYLDDWVDTFGDIANSYRVPDNRSTLDSITPVIDARYAEWQALGQPSVDTPDGDVRLEGDDHALAARRAVEAAGGTVISSADVARAVAGRNAARRTVRDAERERAALLAVSPPSEAAVARLRSALSSQDPVLSTIAATALADWGRVEALSDFAEVVRRGPLSGDAEGWRAVTEAASRLAAQVGPAATAAIETAKGEGRGNARETQTGKS